MGEYVKVTCKECHGEIGEAWVEEIDKPISIEVDAPSCECIDKFGKEQWDDGYEVGFDEGLAEAKTND